MKLFRYVTHDRVRDYELVGWLWVDELPAPHSRYGVLMQWLCGCSYVEPKRD
jgi:hypothetical protein